MNESCSCPPEAGNVTCDLRGSVAISTCPECMKRGRPVDFLTLKALLLVPLTEVHLVKYRFCSTPDCPVVYYSQDGAQTFLETDLRERIFQKHPTEDDVFICYCFRQTIGSIKEENFKRQAASVVARINAGIQAGQCACEIRNPQGSCCLGNVREYINTLEAV